MSAFFPKLNDDTLLNIERLICRIKEKCHGRSQFTLLKLAKIIPIDNTCLSRIQTYKHVIYDRLKNFDGTRVSCMGLPREGEQALRELVHYFCFQYELQIKNNVTTDLFEIAEVVLHLMDEKRWEIADSDLEYVVQRIGRVDPTRPEFELVVRLLTWVIQRRVHHRMPDYAFQSAQELSALLDLCRGRDLLTLGIISNARRETGYAGRHYEPGGICAFTAHALELAEATLPGTIDPDRRGTYADIWLWSALRRVRAKALATAAVTQSKPELLDQAIRLLEQVRKQLGKVALTKEILDEYFHIHLTLLELYAVKALCCSRPQEGAEAVWADLHQTKTKRSITSLLKTTDFAWMDSKFLFAEPGLCAARGLWDEFTARCEDAATNARGKFYPARKARSMGAFEAMRDANRRLAALNLLREPGTADLKLGLR